MENTVMHETTAFSPETIELSLLSGNAKESSKHTHMPFLLCSEMPSTVKSEKLMMVWFPNQSHQFYVKTTGIIINA